MNGLIQSLLQKIPADDTSLKFELSGSLVAEQFKIVKARFPSMNPAKQYGLAILFQYLDLTLFTDQELEEVSKLDLHLLDVGRIPSKPIRILDPNTPLFDTGSSRVYQDLPYDSVFKSSLHLQVGFLSYYSSSNLRELILSLASLSTFY